MLPSSDEPTIKVTDAEYRQMLLNQLGLVIEPIAGEGIKDLENYVLSSGQELPIVRRLYVEREEGPLTPNVIPIKQENHGEPS